MPRRARYVLLTESQEQISLFEWAAIASKQTPEIGMLFAIPNGGARNKITGARLKREGVKKGVPDMFLPVPRGRWHGLFIELKREKGTASLEQKVWISALKELGYCAVIAHGFEAAKDWILKYLGEV